MNVKVKFTGKVSFFSEGVEYEPGKLYTVEKSLAQHPFFEIVEEPKPAAKPKPAKKAEPKDAE